MSEPPGGESRVEAPSNRRQHVGVGKHQPTRRQPTLPALRRLGGTRFELIVCPELLAEIGEALRKPYFLEQIGESAVDDIVAGIIEAATVLEDPRDIEAVLRDPEDDYLLALARQANAEVIVTGDRDLLDHADLTPPAINPREACELVGLL